MGTATHVKELEGFTGHAALYRLEPPMQEDGRAIEYVVVSAANVMFSGPETYIFEADEHGAVVCWGELGGSYRGGLDHGQALHDAGYYAPKASGKSAKRTVTTTRLRIKFKE